MTTQADVLAGLAAAQQVATLAGALAASSLPPGSKAGGYVELATGLLGLLAQAITEQSTETLPDLAALDLQEVAILAEDARVRARVQADADLRAAGG